jgi:leucyl aminopeptidase
MSVSCTIDNRRSVKADAVVIFIYQDESLFKAQRKNLIDSIPHLQPLLDSGDFSGKKYSTSVGYVGSAATAPRFILVGLGIQNEVTTEIIRRSSASATKSAAALRCKHVAFEVPVVPGIDSNTVAQAAVEGAMLSQYGFVKYKSNSDETKPFVTDFTFYCDRARAKAVAKGAAIAQAIVSGVVIARDLANAPNNEIYPQTLAKRASDLGKKNGFSTTILDKKKIEELGMGGLLGVNKGSVNPPVFIVMQYNGGPKSKKPIVLVGKGITFDTGGISIKPAANMSDMKGDMHGAASVIGTMVAASKLGLKKNLIGLIPSTENMPSGSAMVPGDILKFMNGKTAEIDNTDAEGRLVLADALCYAARYNPEVVIDLATLTGACVVALGNVTTGMFGTDEATKGRLKAAADRTNEYVCEMPIYEEYEEMLSSDYADIKNSGGRNAGSITAALFLKHFVSYPWVHLDIAGTSMLAKPSYYQPKGCTGIGVRLLIESLRHW